MLKIILCAAFMLLLPGLARAEEPAPSPEHFLKDIYSHYTSGKTTLDPLGRDKNWLFDDVLLTLIEEDQTHANNKNEVPWLNGDPICNCQEFNKLKNLKIGKAQTGSGPYPVVAVSFTNGAKKESIKYELMPFDDGWKIHDIATADTPSLRDYLSKGIEENKINAAQ